MEERPRRLRQARRPEAAARGSTGAEAQEIRGPRRPEVAAVAARQEEGPDVITMRRLRATQAALRRQVDILVQEIREALVLRPIDLQGINAMMHRLKGMATTLKGVDDQVVDVLVQEALVPDVDTEFQVIGAYQDQITRVDYDVQEMNGAVLKDQLGEIATRRRLDYGSECLKLPKLEIRQYSGKLEDWLGWWAQYRSVHESTSLIGAQKFRYLQQSIEEGTRAADVVGIYQCTDENYEKVIEALKQRCGNEEAITELLLRELVQLVSRKDKLPLTQLYDTLEGKLQSLESLGRRKKRDCEILYPTIEAALPEGVLRSWKKSLEKYQREATEKEESLTKLELLMRFLKAESQREEEIAIIGNTKGSGRDRKRKVEWVEYPPLPKRNGGWADEPIPTASGLLTGARVVKFDRKTDKKNEKREERCLFCNKSHSSRNCTEAMYIPYQQRRERLRVAGGCFKCFRNNHRVSQCRTKAYCQVCKGSHFVSMCPSGEANSKEESRPSPSKRPDAAVPRTVTNCLSQKRTMSLGTVPLQTLRVMVFGPSESKVIRAVLDPGSQKSAILKKTAAELKLPVHHKVLMGHSLYSGCETKFVDHRVHRIKVKGLTGDFGLELNLIDEEKIVSTVPVVNPAELPREMEGQQIKFDNSDGTQEIELLLGNDVYGRLLTGKVHQMNSGFTAIETHLGWVLSGESNADGDAEIVIVSMMNSVSVSQLWDLDLIGIKDPIETRSKRDLEEDIKSHFLQTLRRNTENRYEVNLPWTAPKANVLNNWNQALKRLVSASNKLKVSGHWVAYGNIFKEWLAEGIIEVVEESDPMSAACHYLPHRAVIKEGSATTKVRPVFDASCKIGKSYSLNDCLAKGPNQLELIPDILLRFRLRKVGAIADIKKAFLQISVAPEDREYLRFLWWEQDVESVKIFRHRRVVFGVNSSPFQLAAVIEHHLANVPEDLKPTAAVMLKSFYVDNLVISLDSDAEFVQFRQAAVNLMKDANMDLRLWEKNGDQTLGADASQSSVLGVQWNKDRDTLAPALAKVLMPEKVTKRSILSAGHALYDPLGMMTPISLLPKFCLRESCLQKLGWDDPVPAQTEAKFRRWCLYLKNLGNYELPRRLAEVNPEEGEWSLHIFSDASQDAYAAVVYVRVKTDAGVTVRLAQAKSRLSPSNATIPRLELLGCLIAARLTKTVKMALGMDWPTTYWTDSMTALTWIRRHEMWGTFVNNRVAEIRQLSFVNDCRHVPGVLNPADLPSRGCTTSQFLTSQWWEGPQWLYQKEEMWPSEHHPVDEGKVSEERRKTVPALLSTVFTSWFLPTNSYRRNIRVLAWILRWKRGVKRCGELVVEELNAAEKVIWRLAQLESGVTNQKTGIELHQVNGLWCVKTRITMRDDDANFVTPVYIPKKHPVVGQLIEAVHLENHHAGANIVLSKLREKVWIPSGKKSVAKVLKNCKRCKRFAAHPMQCETGSLPKERVSDSRVFETTGVDYGGHLFLRDGSKAWFVIFTCVVYRAVHLELVLSLSTEAFVQALKRIHVETGLDKIVWKFNPATAAWWGGWWERLIGIIKQMMRKTLGTSRLTQDEMTTLLCEIEAKVNSRPLTVLGEDANDLVALTPAMFIQDIVEINVPDLDEIQRNQMQRRYRYRQTLKEALRRRFRSEYLGKLIHHSKKINCAEVNVGDVVLITCDNKKRLDWPMARIVEKYPGRDGVCRLVRVKTSGGETLRPLQRLVPLEVGTGVLSEGGGQGPEVSTNEELKK